MFISLNQPVFFCLIFFVDEDDENIFVWYLLGWIGCMQGKEQYVNSKLSLEQALQIGSKKGFLQSGMNSERIYAFLGVLAGQSSWLMNLGKPYD